MKVIITRDSVCMADDCFAPNETIIHINRHASIELLLQEIIKQNYLPKMSWLKSAWVMKINKKTIAVVSPRWHKARYIVDKNQKVGEYCRLIPSIKVHFEYISDSLPEMVYFKARST